MKKDDGNGLSCVGVSPGLNTDRDGVESVAGMAWNQWPRWRGIADRDAVEWVTGITWNMQPDSSKANLGPSAGLFVLDSD